MGRIGGETGLAKLKKNIYQGIIPLDTVDANNPPVVAVGLAAFPRENFGIFQELDRDNSGVWAMGDNQRGQETGEKKTATEQSIVDKNSNSRLDAERRQALKYFIQGTRKLGALIQRYGSPNEYTMIVGPEQTQRLMAWDLQSIQGEFAYTARPDSAIRLDQAQSRTQSLKLYEMLAKDPNVKRSELLVEVCREWNLDPARVVIPELPEKPPDPANVSFRFNAADIDPRNPNFPIVMSILQQSGYKIDPAVIAQAQGQAAFQSQVMNAGAGAGDMPHPPGMMPPPNGQPPKQTEHGGAAPKAEPISKHHAQETGERPGRKPLVQ